MLNVCQHLERTGRARVHVIGVGSSGDLDLDAYRAALSEKTALVSIMWANNETGTIFPVAELAALAKAAGALFHTDAVQAFGKIELALKDKAIDLLSLSGHKIHGAQGRRRALRQEGRQAEPAVSRRQAGARTPRRHRKHAGDRRPRHGRRDRP